MRLTLGCDLGTTKFAAVILDESGRVVASHSVTVNCAAEDDAERLISAAFSAVSALPRPLLRAVSAVGVATQMHGVVLLGARGLAAVSPFVSWQDSRCDAQFLAKLCADTGGHSLASGFGCATVAWWAAHRALPADAASCCSLGDLFVARLTASAKPSMDQTNAAAFGLYDHSLAAWDTAALSAAGIPQGLMPAPIVAPGTVVGRVCEGVASSTGIPQGVPVCAAVGDFQAALLTSLSKEDPFGDVAINIGTSAQLAVLVDPSLLHDVPSRLREPGGSFEYRPFFGGRVVLTAASLCGGCSWAWLVQTLRSWMAELGCNEVFEESAIYDRLSTLGLAAVSACAQRPQSLSVRPTLSGERHDPELKGTIGGITTSPENMQSLGAFSAAFVRGIVHELATMLPHDALNLQHRKRVVGSGNALRRSKLFQHFASTELGGLPLVLVEVSEEAAVGAAKMAADA